MKGQMLQLSGCYVRVRRVPAWFALRVVEHFKMPRPPLEVVETVAGTEVQAARPGSPEYEKYLEELDRARQELQNAQYVAALNAGVVAWSFDGESWESEPPEDWQLDPVFAVSSTGDRRADYLLHEILVDSRDLAAVADAIREEPSEASIEEAKKLFRG